MKSAMKLLMLIATLLALSGCATFANRISVSLAGDEMYVNSMYGPLGVTSKVDSKDLEAIKKTQSAVIELLTK